MKKILLYTMCLCLTCTAFAAEQVEKFPCEEDQQQCLLEVLETGESGAPLRAAMLLSGYSDQATIQALASKLSSSDPMMATIALHVLIRIGEPSSNTLLTMTENDSPQIREYAVYGLAHIGKGYKAEDLFVLLLDPSMATRKRLVDAAVALGTKGYPLLEALCVNNNIEVRAMAVRALGDCDHKEALNTLERAMTDMHAQVGEQAVYAMVKKGQAAVPKLRRLLVSGDEVVKVRVLMALAGIGDPSVNAGVVKTLNHPDAKVVYASIYTLSVTGDKLSVRPLRNLRKPDQKLGDVNLGEYARKVAESIEHRIYRKK